MTALRRLGGRTAGIVLVAGAVAFCAASPAAADRAGEDLEFADQEIVASEGDGELLVVVRRAATLALEESRAWFTTVERSAVDGDYIPVSGWLRMAVGQTTASIAVTVVDDDEEEPGDQSFAVRLAPSPQSGIVIDEVVVNVRDDDAPRWASGDTIDAANTSPARSAAAAAKPSPAPASPTPVQVQRRVASAQAPARRSAAARRPQETRVTPFELRTPSESPSSIAVPEHATPLAAAALLAALALGRVSAELWFRWRTLTE